MQTWYGYDTFGKRTWKEESRERAHLPYELGSPLRIEDSAETLRRVMDTDSLERPVSEHRRYIEQV